VTQEPRDIGGVEQRLGGNAADVDADPAELLLLDHRGAHAQLGGPDGGDVAGRPPAQDDNVKLTGHRYSSIADCGLRIADFGLRILASQIAVLPIRNPQSPIRNHNSIASGFSSICLSVLRNAAPVAPSITRWSHLMVI